MKPAPPPQRELAVVLHGLACTHHIMWRIAGALRKDGYRVARETYPSRTMPLEKLAAQWLPRLLEQCHATDATRVHFVTHSMGGILVRLWLRDLPAPKNLGRIVMIAPPNHGSEIPDHLDKNPLFRLLFGINGPRLGANANSLPRQLSQSRLPPKVEVGIIAGGRTLNPLFSAWIGSANDGKVSVRSTQLDGMSDHITLPRSHTSLLMCRETCTQTLHFLNKGQFLRRPSSRPRPTR
jgi:pimeloyl-ACP methyl ester carboxylesterase